MSIKIDPHALNAFAAQANDHSTELGKLQITIDLPSNILGSFGEACDLVATINSHTSEINQRLQATAHALAGLSRAASNAAKLTGASDADIAKSMKTINSEVDAARRKLARPHPVPPTP